MTTTREFREEALKLAETVGIPAAKKKSAVSQRETELTIENACLKRHAPHHSFIG